MNFACPSSLYHVDCDVGHLARADLSTVGALLRATLNAQRQGERLRVVNASWELQELIAFSGLGYVLLGRCERQPEEREEALGVEERGEADDLPV
jgi:ABC-type transporter Mla MlaB component